MNGTEGATRPIFSCIVKNGECERSVYGMYDSGCTSAVLLSSVSESVNIVTNTHLCHLSTFDEDKCEKREFASFELLSRDRSVDLILRVRSDCSLQSSSSSLKVKFSG